MSPQSDEDAWVEAVLEVKLTPTGTRAGTGAMVQQPLVAYRSLLLRWRDAQSKAATALRKIGETLLALPEVQSDPRLEEVKSAVEFLPSMIPNFGDALADALDAGLNAGSGVEQRKAAEESVAVIDAYRTQLKEAGAFLELDAFATAQLRVDARLFDTLDGELAAIKETLTKSAGAIEQVEREKSDVRQ